MKQTEPLSRLPQPMASEKCKRRISPVCALCFVSNMWSGSQHDSTKVPLLLVGGLGGTLETGRVLDFIDAGDDNRKLCSLSLSIMNRMGEKQIQFGDAEMPLAHL